ncbi:MAG: GMC family oxidoreductase, partial [Bdellovibrionales bacterium]|nr:GMC family oxidoreductase [Bdellovibrionales bacterium]
GFASSFFLLSYLSNTKKNARVLVLERGQRKSFEWQLKNQAVRQPDPLFWYINKNKEKYWNHFSAFGGGSNCWWACTPRFLPSDFKLHSTYGVGKDWPLSYEDLEPFYCHAEEIMSVAGPDNSPLFPRSQPYPQPAHLMTDPDKIFAKSHPGLFFSLPTARPSRATKNRQPCCNSGVCSLCPINSKFTIENELAYLYQDTRVTLQLDSTALAIETENTHATGVHYKTKEREEFVRGDLVVLGANALFNPFLLQKSGIDHPVLGRGLNEQVSKRVTVLLDGIKNFQGSTSLTGHGYMLYDGPHRSEHAGALMETSNIPQIRMERGKMRNILSIKFIFEDLAQENNRVVISTKDNNIPETVFHDYSDYALQGIDKLPEKLPQVLEGLPVEDVIISPSVSQTESHILGTTPMGSDPSTSIVDRHLVHHTHRNIVVLGGSTFPVSSPSNPTLTLSALSLWACHHLFENSGVRT